jgi:hypothetical protein
VQAGRLVIDASCLINLLATGRQHEILQALGIQLLITDRTGRETLYLDGSPDENGDPTRDLIDLAPLETAGLLQILSSDDPALLDAFVRCAQHLRDADAASVALAATLDLPFATDDSRQRRVARELYPRLKLVSTLALLREAAARLGLNRQATHQLAVDLRDRGSFLPPKNDPDRKWYEDALGVGG